MTLGAHTIIHNAIEHDYCIAECIASVLPLVDRFLVIECESTDGTLKLLQSIAAKEPKLLIVRDTWNPLPAGNKWKQEIADRNYRKLETDWHIAMDADELLHPDEYELIKDHISTSKNCGALYRHTFWKNAQNKAPDERVGRSICGRVGPISELLCFDHLYPEGTVEIKGASTYHYGHIRDRKSWARKSVKMHQWSLGYVPQWWSKAESGDWKQVDEHIPEYDLVPFSGTHPPMIHQWLIDRGYHP